MPDASATSPIAPPQSIDFPHKVALTKPANSRVTRHFANSFKLMGQEQRNHAKPSRRESCFATRVAAANNYDIKLCVFHKALKFSKHLPKSGAQSNASRETVTLIYCFYYFPIQKLEKTRSSTASISTSPASSLMACNASRRSTPTNSGAINRLFLAGLYR